jgi:hypothetical protein
VSTSGYAQSRPRIVLIAACVAGELGIPSDRDRPAAAEHQPAGTTRLASRRGASATSWRRATSFSNPATFAQRLLAAVATSYSPESLRYKSLEAHGQLARCLHCARASGPFSASRGERDGVGRLDCSRKTPESVWDGRRGAGYRTRHRRQHESATSRYGSPLPAPTARDSLECHSGPPSSRTSNRRPNNRELSRSRTPSRRGSGSDDRITEPLKRVNNTLTMVGRSLAKQPSILSAGAGEQGDGCR